MSSSEDVAVCTCSQPMGRAEVNVAASDSSTADSIVEESDVSSVDRPAISAVGMVLGGLGCELAIA